MMRDDAFAQWLGEKHRCYDLLQAGICVISADDQEEVLFANQSVLEMYECSSWDEFHELVHGTWTGMSADDFAGLDHIGPDQSLHLQMHFTGKKGSSRCAYAVISRLPAETGSCFLLQMWCPQVDASLHDHDDLTGFVSLAVYQRRVNDLFGTGGTGAEKPWALVHFDIANFRGYNQRYGTDAGNRCLVLVASVLKDVIPDGLMCRVNADQFHVVLPPDDAEKKVEEVCVLVNERMGTHIASLKAGIVYLHPHVSVKAVISGFDRAVHACAAIKNGSSRNTAVYDEKMQEMLDTRTYILDHLEQAMSSGWIQIWYQPVVHTYFRTVSSFEALARWQDPVRGMISPGIFVPILEQAGKIEKLDRYVMTQVVKDLHERLLGGSQVVPVSLNLSQMDFQLMSPLDELNALTMHYEVPRHLLHIEITERVVAKSREQMETAINRFHEAGYDVWLDDFGSAYSSLNALHSYSFDLIKLDMEFFRNFDQRSRDIITSIVTMAKRLGMHTLAEGVETRDQLAFLRQIGCELIQGYYFSRPVPVALIPKTLAAGHLRLEKELEGAVYGAIGLMDIIAQNSAGLFLVDHGYVHVFAANHAFMRELENIGLNSLNALNQSLISASVSVQKKLHHYLESVLDGGEEKAVTVVLQDQYIRLQASMAAGVSDFWAGSLQIINISDDRQGAWSRGYDAVFRNLVLLYDSICCIDTEDDEVEVMFTHHLQIHPESHISGISALAQRFCHELVHACDQQRFLSFMDLSSLNSKLHDSSQGYVQDLFRVKDNTGNYLWTVFKAVQTVRDGRTDILICEAVDLWEHHSSRKELLPEFSRSMEPELQAVSTDMSQQEREELAVFHSFLKNAGIPFFWKDRQLRYRGVNDLTLDRLGGLSWQQIEGRTVRELGIMVDPDSPEKLEKDILQDGRTRNGGSLLHLPGSLRRRAVTEFPWYRGNQIAGVAGVVHTCAEDSCEVFLKDEKTGLFNIYGTMLAGENMVRSYRLSHENFFCAVIALHDEQRLIRFYGQEFVDRITEAAVGILSDVDDPGIIAAHLDGCRFCLLGKKHEAVRLVKIADRVAQCVSALCDTAGLNRRLRMDGAMAEGTEESSVLGMMKLLNQRLQDAKGMPQDFDSLREML